MAESAKSIDPGVDIGHVHLKVAEIDRALDFYCGVLGFELQQRLGSGAAFISAGGYHHHIGLNTWESKGGHPPPPGTTGLFHTAILYPTRPALADALHRVLSAGIELDGASDHGVSEALYLRDPDQNGVELYWDRPREQWPVTPDGHLSMGRLRLAHQLVELGPGVVATGELDLAPLDADVPQPNGALMDVRVGHRRRGRGLGAGPVVHPEQGVRHAHLVG